MLHTKTPEKNGWYWIEDDEGETNMSYLETERDDPRQVVDVLHCEQRGLGTLTLPYHGPRGLAPESTRFMPLRPLQVAGWLLDGESRHI